MQFIFQKAMQWSELITDNFFISTVNSQMQQNVLRYMLKPAKGKNQMCFDLDIVIKFGL